MNDDGIVVSIGDLKPDQKNARRHTPRNVGSIVDSLHEVGAARSIVIDEDNVILAGNATVEAAGEAGIEHVRIIPAKGNELIAVQRTGLSARQKTRLALFDNRSAELAEWEPEVLAGMEPADLDGIFTREELGDILGESEVKELAAIGEPVTKLGDLYLLGEHRLLCGDCRDIGVVLKLFGDEKASVVVTSPPYASQRAYDPKSGFTPIPPDEYLAWFADVQSNIRSILAEDGSYFLNIKEHCEDGQRSLYVKDLTLAHVRTWGWRFVDEFCWVRAGVPGGWPNRFKNGFEPIFHFAASEEIKFRPDAVSHDTEHAFDYSPDNGKSVSGSGLLGKEHGARFRSGKARPSNVLDVGTGGAKVSGQHSAEYPVRIPAFFAMAFADAGDIISDPFLGGGTTLIAAEKTGRRGYGSEISPKYCDVIVKRWEQLTGKTATLETGAAVATAIT